MSKVKPPTEPAAQAKIAQLMIRNAYQPTAEIGYFCS